MDAITPSPKTGSEALFSDSFESPTPPEPPVQLPPFAVRVLTKCGYGPRPGDVSAFNALGGNDDARLNAWLTDQLNPDSISDTDCNNRISAGNYATYTMSLSQMWAKYVRGDSQGWPQRYYPCDEAACIKLIRAVYSKRQLYEVMVDFWHNHFNVQGWEFSIAPVFMHYDRDVMRGKNSSNRFHALGNFRALLEEVAKAPAMLVYLDNKSSRGAGFNENFARELCELHTLGAAHYYPTNDPEEVPLDGNNIPLGYCDNDVYEAARALTGWTMRDDHWEFPNSPEYDTGEFLYHAPWHDRAGKYFLGRYMVANRPALADGHRVFDQLSQHLGTARNICRKLCVRFIGDEPPQSLIDSAAALWQSRWDAPDQIAQVLRHILTSAAFKESWGDKVKRPWEALMQSLRATSAELTPRVRQPAGVAWNDYADLTTRLHQSGHGPFLWPTPDGYPDRASKWQAVSPLAQTWRTLARLTEMRTPGSDANSPTAYFQRIEQVTRAAFPGPPQSTAGAVVDFWIGRIYGYALAQERRDQLVRFLGQKANTAAAATTQLTWNNEWANEQNPDKYYTLGRLRTTVSLLMMCPEFYHR